MVAPTQARDTAHPHPSHLTTTELDRLRLLLEEELVERRAALAAGAPAVDDADRDMVDALAARTAERIVDIEEALDRLAGGGYGACERCASAIPFERLEAMPSARRCVACPEGPTNLFG